MKTALPAKPSYHFGHLDDTCTVVIVSCPLNQAANQLAYTMVMMISYPGDGLGSHQTDRDFGLAWFLRALPRSTVHIQHSSTVAILSKRPIKA